MMIEQYARMNRLLRAITRRCNDGLEAHTYAENAEILVATYVQDDLRELARLWPEGLQNDALVSAQSAAGQEMWMDTDGFRLIRDEHLPRMAEALDDYFCAFKLEGIGSDFLDLLHPTVLSASYGHFRVGRYRDAVVNSVIAVFDLIRERTKLDKDGSDLVGHAFSLENPHLIVASLDTESGRNQQKGLMQLLTGAYQGLRSPAAHSLRMPVTQQDAARQLILSSFLAAWVEACTLVKGTDGESQPA